jgi:hypothetical protein
MFRRNPFVASIEDRHHGRPFAASPTRKGRPTADQSDTARAEAAKRTELKRQKRAMLMDRDHRPAALPVNASAIPDEMRAAPRWCLWGWVWRTERGEWGKVPMRTNGANARSNDPATWCDSAAAVAAYERGGFDGLGFMLGDGWVGVDLDVCRDPATGALCDPARTIVGTLNSYTEVSPTRTGLKIFVRGKKPRGECKSPDNEIEMYELGRYFTVTGIRIEEA